ncbi:MAG: HPP family protein [Gammaproteobacteria bacterium]|nr:HPP family protein [Gammaproteobacteria bacterium]
MNQNSLIRSIGATSLGASAFLVFAAPLSKMAERKRLIGSYIIAIIIGVIWHYLTRYTINNLHLSFTPDHIRIFYAALATVITMMVMIVTSLQHPPAAGLPLALVTDHWSIGILSAIFITVLLIALIKTWLKKWLIPLV